MADALQVLSLGAGKDSTALLLLSALGRLPKLDAAIFADTGWEPKAVYDHLDRLEREVAGPAGIPIYRVSTGDLRSDSLRAGRGRVKIPLFTKTQDGHMGFARRRQCTQDYKIVPIKRKVRELLGYPSPRNVPAGVTADQWVGIRRDEFHRAKDSHVRFLTNVHPLLWMPGSADGKEGWTRGDCERFLREQGFGETPKSACIGCPFHGNRQWRELRDNSPEEWADAVAFDRALREGPTAASFSGTVYLHVSGLPLDEAPIDRKTWTEWRSRQTDLFDAIADQEIEEGAADGCAPWSCRGDAA